MGHIANQGVSLSIKGCIHIGAHEGQEYPLYEAFGIENLLFYEALPDNFKKLEEKLKEYSFNSHKNIIVDARNVALGNINGTVEMHLEDRGLSSSVLKPKVHLWQYPGIKFEEKETVKITRLDDEEFDRGKYNFINIDVQGYELEVLRGAEETLKHVDLILAEVNKQEMYEGCAMIDEMDEFLEERNFHRIATYWQQDYGSWGDALYLKVNK